MDINPTNQYAGSTEGESSLPGAVPAWEMIEAGRYQPRRIRGSYRGRELG